MQKNLEEALSNLMLSSWQENSAPCLGRVVWKSWLRECEQALGHAPPNRAALAVCRHVYFCPVNKYIGNRRI